MTQEEKDLLFKDLSARLPYHVKCKVWLEDGTTEEGLLDLQHNYGDVLQDAFYYDIIKDIKPYLFPLSSMIEEQKEIRDEILDSYNSMEQCYIELIDFYNKNHFDYHYLISKGLAIDATGLNIY